MCPSSFRVSASWPGSGVGVVRKQYTRVPMAAVGNPALLGQSTSPVKHFVRRRVYPAKLVHTRAMKERPVWLNQTVRKIRWGCRRMRPHFTRTFNVLRAYSDKRGFRLVSYLKSNGSSGALKSAPSGPSATSTPSGCPRLQSVSLLSSVNPPSLFPAPFPSPPFLLLVVRGL